MRTLKMNRRVVESVGEMSIPWHILFDFSLETWSEPRLGFEKCDRILCSGLYQDIFLHYVCFYDCAATGGGGGISTLPAAYARAPLYFISFWFIYMKLQRWKKRMLQRWKVLSFVLFHCLLHFIVLFSWGYFCTLSILLLVSLPGSEVRWGLYDSEGMIWLSAWISPEPTWVYPCHRDWSIATLLGPKVRWERYDPQGWSDSRLESLQNPRDSSLVIETYPPSVS